MLTQQGSSNNGFLPPPCRAATHEVSPSLFFSLLNELLQHRFSEAHVFTMVLPSADALTLGVSIAQWWPSPQNGVSTHPPVPCSTASFLSL